MRTTKKKPNKTPYVVVFGAASCPWCAKAKSFFARHGLGYRYVDVVKTPEAKGLCHRHGCYSLPVIAVGEQWMSGFDEGALKKLLLK